MSTQPPVRYCTTSDGVRIAFTVTGRGPVVVSLLDPIVSHVGLEWSNPGNGPVLEAQARYFTLVRLDLRGTGLSDRVPPKGPDDGLRDIEAVVNRLGLDQFTLQVNTSATPFAVAFAANNPHRVSRLVIIDGALRAADINASPQMGALLAAAAADWETATEVIGAIAFGAGREEARLHGEYVRACVNPDYFAAIVALMTADSSTAASTLTMPVLVVRHLGYRIITDEMTNHLMSCIPDARLVTVKGMWPDDIEGLAQRIAAFVYEGEGLSMDGIASAPKTIERAGVTAIILFADIADSTALTEHLGDGEFRTKARGLDAALRARIGANGGTVIDAKTLGDGILATFQAAASGIAAAISLEPAAEQLGLSLHVGLHAGDVIREEGNVFGGAVNIAARICALSAPGEILVSDVVRGMARTSAGVSFIDRGEYTLKGIGEPLRIFAVQDD